MRFEDNKYIVKSNGEMILFYNSSTRKLYNEKGPYTQSSDGYKMFGFECIEITDGTGEYYLDDVELTKE